MSAEEEHTAVEAPSTETPLSKEELIAKLEQLKASATQQYSLKNYDDAAEFYSEAAEVQDELNGEMSPENADLLYQYGRCLYHVAVAKSTVLGGLVAGSEERKRKKRKVAKPESSSAGGANGTGESSVISDALKNAEQKLAEENEGVKKEEKAPMPFFQIAGDDEDWEVSDDEDKEEDDDEAADAEADAEAEEEESDFAIAFEILDTARVLLSKKLAALQEASGKSTKKSAEIRQIKERIADTHDLLAEISLEDERYREAIADTRAALVLREEFYPHESSLLAEAHFKLSLSLEFASVTSTLDEASGKRFISHIDEKLRDEAALEGEKAIASCEARVAKETAALDQQTDAAKKAEQEQSIEEVKEMIEEMKERLVELRVPIALGSLTGPSDDQLRGILGAMLGESKDEKAKRIAEATAGANDLSGLVKHRKKPKVEEGVVDGKGKRKAEAVSEVVESANENGKKVKFDDAE